MREQFQTVVQLLIDYEDLRVSQQSCAQNDNADQLLNYPEPNVAYNEIRGFDGLASSNSDLNISSRDLGSFASTPTMQTIHSRCGYMVEARNMCTSVYNRLADLSFQAMTGSLALDSCLQDFEDFLAKYGSERLIARFLTNVTFIATCETFHGRLDDLMRVHELGSSISVHDWKTQFKIDSDSRCECFEKALTSQTELLATESQAPVAQKEVLALLLLDSKQRKANYSSDEVNLIKLVTKNVTGFSRLSIPSWPKWFVPPHEVEFDTHSFASAAYGSVHRGTWEGTEVVVKLVGKDPESRAIFYQ